MAIDVSNVHVFSHSNIRIEGTAESMGACSGAGVCSGASDTKTAHVLYFDVFEMDTEPHDADILFITHNHYDHYSPKDAKKVVNKNTIIMAPVSLVEYSKKVEADPASVATSPDEPPFEPLSALGATRIIGVEPGDEFFLEGIKVEAVHAYNVKPERLGFHPKENNWVGYVVTVDGIRYYIAGDTDQNPDNETIDCDVMLVPVGGTYTCNTAEAAAFANAIKPTIAIPTHYGSITGKKTDGDEFAKLVDSSITVVKKLPW